MFDDFTHSTGKFGFTNILDTLCFQVSKVIFIKETFIHANAFYNDIMGSQNGQGLFEEFHELTVTGYISTVEPGINQFASSRNESYFYFVGRPSVITGIIAVFGSFLFPENSKDTVINIQPYFTWFITFGLK